MKKFSLPNLVTNPQVFCTYIFNKKSYNFKFRWCDNFCILDIYLVQDGEKVYLLQGRPLTAGTDITSRVNDQNLINGKLSVENKFGNESDPERSNFHTDFELVYDGEE